MPAGIRHHARDACPRDPVRGRGAAPGRRTARRRGLCPEAGEPGNPGGDRHSAEPGSGPAGPTPVPSFARPTPLPAPTFLAYAVRAGDTLTSIAREFRTTPRSIAFWSRGEHPSLDPESAAYQPDRLEVGWILRLIPDSVFDEDELMDATPSPTAS
ncbi:MAG: LysM peptidoglycan-binding domain-containing protein [Chloroflexi bacterium]|nr:LysM peptidoglycan-binding domain-containing protein [Chloroflexota bacterium]